ncbi:hypothetical protein [Mesorhizobium sp. B2-4-17]|uniref:hypothetical protein n=1 Tax=Mesorhizobium sp. B2-4-17 TaxID=2589932 RepID=UPI00112D175F|nr:hypothetical protein [Mesorhizobium sp. B2-4-17]TPK87364.1 hypothetical protein FJ548_14295 [Mesorhizobium sp. B2-4-17]
MNSPYHYVIYIRPRSGTLECSVDQKTWRDTGLSAATVYDGITAETLGQLLDTLGRIEEIEEVERDLPYRRQQAIGRKLNAGLFGPASPPIGHPHIHLVPIVSDDESAESENFFDLFLRLPWMLLTDRNDGAARFLALCEPNPTAITVDAAPANGEPRVTEVKLPPYPKILLICPSKSVPPTGGQQHGADLERILKSHYDPAERSDRIVKVETFAEFVTCLNKTPRFSPHIIYFYGHATAQGEDTVLQFGPTEDDSGWHSIDALQQPLLNLVARTNFPPIVWINACKGAAAKRNSALRALGPTTAAVIATRTLAVVEDSLKLGTIALPMIAIDGKAPPLALRDAIAQLVEDAPQDSVKSARWATTIVAIQYKLWSPLGTEERKIDDAESGGDIPMRLDRTVPLLKIREYLDKALQAPANTAHAILWHGSAEDSTDVFAQRFVDYASEGFSNWSSVSYNVELQAQSQSKGKIPFLESVYRALNNLPATAIIGKIRDENIKTTLQQFNDGQPTFVTLSHGPFDHSHIEMLRDYLAFWNDLFPTLELDPKRAQILLGLRFVREGPPVSLDTDSPLFVQVPLGPVLSDELAWHLEKYYPLYSVSKNNIDKEVEDLIELHGSSFRNLHLALEEKLQFEWWTLKQG